MNENGHCGRVERLMRQATQLEAQIGEIRERANELIKQAQEHCKHPNLEGKAGSNTGNWCPQDDCYWLDLHCPDCRMRLHIAGDDPLYRIYSPYGNAPEGFNYKETGRD